MLQRTDLQFREVAAIKRKDRVLQMALLTAVVLAVWKVVTMGLQMAVGAARSALGIVG